MNNRKPRILFVNEFHRLASGYGTYGNELLSRLHKSGKYELFELAQYGDPDDPRIYESPWKVFPNLPRGYTRKQADPAEAQLYHSSIFNEFGAWKFEQACLESQADIVYSHQDFWYMQYQETSPFRPLYNWIISPACDSQPQNEQWISAFTNADYCASYTKWGADVLREEGGGLINVVGDISPGVDLQIFTPILNKKTHKQKYGFDPQALIVGFLNRNQKRKLIPDLIAAFAEYIATAPKDLADRTILYLGTSYPDIGWNIPRLVKKSGVANKIYFSYICADCQLLVPQPFKNAVDFCPRCNHRSLRMPSTHLGLSREQLAEVYGLFDVYVQYANSEGIGMSQLEAAACGVPVMSVDYSGMHDVLEKLNGIPIKVLKLITESETGCQRAIPDDADFISKLIKFLSLPESLRHKKGMETRQLATKHYNWDDNAAKWMNVFDSVKLKENVWTSPPRLHQPPQGYPSPQQLSDGQFVNWAMVNILGRPDLLNSYLSFRLLRDLNIGATSSQNGSYYSDMSCLGLRPQFRNFGRQELVDELTKMVQNNNAWESRRYQMVQQGLIK